MSATEEDAATGCKALEVRLVSGEAFSHPEQNHQLPRLQAGSAFVFTPCTSQKWSTYAMWVQQEKQIDHELSVATRVIQAAGQIPRD